MVYVILSIISVIFLIALFLACLADQVEDARIGKTIELVPKKGATKILNILARYPALAVLVFAVAWLRLYPHRTPYLFVAIFLLFNKLCKRLLRNRRVEEKLLAKQLYLDANSVFLSLLLLIFAIWI